MKTSFFRPVLFGMLLGVAFFLIPFMLLRAFLFIMVFMAMVRLAFFIGFGGRHRRWRHYHAMYEQQDGHGFDGYVTVKHTQRGRGQGGSRYDGRIINID